MGCASAPPEPAAPKIVPARPHGLERARLAEVPAERASAYLQVLDALYADSESDPAVIGEAVAELRKPRLAAALTPRNRFRVDAIALEVALAAGDRDAIEALAAALDPVDPSQRLAADRLRARALAEADDAEAAALALLAIIDRLDAAGGDLSAYTAAAWRQLSRLPLPTLRRLSESASSPGLASWLDVALAFNTALTSHQQAAVWQRFRLRQPDHIAVRFPPPNILLGTAGPSDIALLLPFSGDLANLADAIRDGFLAAYLEVRRETGAVQTVRLYDTAARTPVDAYRRALTDGADIVVGPLEKAAVAELAMLPPDRPVIALNSLDIEPGADTGVLQLALAPEDDAMAIASALAGAGVERVLVFGNGEAWSMRARARFNAEIAAMEAPQCRRLAAPPPAPAPSSSMVQPPRPRGDCSIEVLGVGTLASNSDATTVAGDLLGIAASQARHAALARLLGVELTFVPRRRDDIDAIVAFVNSQQLMALKPALDFHFATDITLYAPSQAVRGVAWGRLEGLRVCNVPWLLHGEPLRDEASALATSRGPLASLFALGVDGYRLANQLVRTTLRGESVAGSTGMLTVGEGGRIRRQLAWGRVSNGQLIAVPAP